MSKQRIYNEYPDSGYSCASSARKCLAAETAVSGSGVREQSLNSCETMHSGSLPARHL